MARKHKIGIDYFSHDVDMLQDKKVKLLKAKFGLVGYAVYNRLLEEIYRDKGYFLKIDEDFTLLFCDESKIDYEKFIVILNECIDKELFNKEIFEEFNIITSKRIQINYMEATKRRSRVEFLKEYLLVNNKEISEHYNLKKVNVNINNLNVNINEVNADISTQRKGKERKEKESKQQPRTRAKEKPVVVNKKILVEKVQEILDDQVNEKEAAKLLHLANNNLDTVQEKAKVMEQYSKTNSIKSVHRYMIAAIKDDYTINQDVPKSKINGFHNFTGSNKKYTNDEILKTLGVE